MSVPSWDSAAVLALMAPFLATLSWRIDSTIPVLSLAAPVASPEHHHC